MVRVQQSPHSGFPVLDSRGELVGLVTYQELREGLIAEKGTPIVVADLMRLDPPVAYPDELLVQVVNRMSHHDMGRLPVVERDHPRKLVGIITDQDVVQALGEAAQKPSPWTEAKS